MTLIQHSQVFKSVFTLHHHWNFLINDMQLENCHVGFTTRYDLFLEPILKWPFLGDFRSHKECDTRSRTKCGLHPYVSNKVDWLHPYIQVVYSWYHVLLISKTIHVSLLQFHRSIQLPTTSTSYPFLHEIWNVSIYHNNFKRILPADWTNSIPSSHTLWKTR